MSKPTPEQSHRYYVTHKAQVAAANRRWRLANPEKARQLHRDWHLAHLESGRRYAAETKERHPERVSARVAVMNAVQSGRLTRQPCAVCGLEPAEAHHEDYSKPLDVEWLCRTHHRAWHRIFKTVLH